MIRQFLIIILALLNLPGFSHVLAQQPPPQPSPGIPGEGEKAASLSAQFIVHSDRFAGGPFVGFGADMNPYLFCRPNWGAVNEQNAADLEKKIIDLAPQHVRIFS